MSISRQDVPVWVACVVSGLVSAGLLTVYAMHDRPGSDPVRVALGGVVTGVFVGVVVGWFAVKQRRAFSGVVGDLSPGDRAAATSATSRGPVPQDGEIRRAAARIAAHQLESMTRNRRRRVTFFGAAVVLYVYLAVTSGPWGWAGAALFAVVLGIQLWWPRRLQRRVDLLSAEDAHL